jgi:hypothetical protein
VRGAAADSRHAAGRLVIFGDDTDGYLRQIEIAAASD